MRDALPVPNLSHVTEDLRHALHATDRTAGTETATARTALVGEQPPLLLPENPPRRGPVTRRLLLTRASLALAANVAVGTALVFGLDDPRAQAAGLSLIVPGGGLLYTGFPVLFLACLVLFGLGLVLWWGVSAVLAPVAAVAAGVLGAVLTAPEATGAASAWSVPVVYGLFAAVVGTGIVRDERTHRAKAASIPAINEYLRSAQDPKPSRTLREPDDLDAQALKFFLEMGLQPLEQFDGFDYGEQYHGGTCLRYQLTALGSALAVGNANLLPNYPSLIGKAQENLVAKQTDIRVWRYWRTENILGRLNANPDPIVRDNIMFSGFLASHIGEFEAATGSTRFDEPGSLTFTWRDGRQFVYDHHSLVEAVARNFETSELGIFPCEPGWVFSICNAMAAQGVRSHETSHGAGVWSRVEPVWRRGIFGEMMTADGAIRHIRSSSFGFSFNDGDGTGEYYRSGNHNFEDTAPDMSRRGALLQLRGVAEKISALEHLVDGGELKLTFKPKPERGTRFQSSLTEWLGVVAGAMAVGNDTVAAAALRRLQRDCATGHEFPERPMTGGVMMTAALMSIVWGAPLTASDLAVRGYVPPTGPTIDHAPWPAVLVTKARCDDGETLHLVVEPYQCEPGEPVELTFTVPHAGRTYRLTGEGADVELLPDAEGRCKATIALRTRTAMALRPS